MELWVSLSVSFRLQPNSWRDQTQLSLLYKLNSYKNRNGSSGSNTKPPILFTNPQTSLFISKGLQILYKIWIQETKALLGETNILSLWLWGVKVLLGFSRNPNPSLWNANLRYLMSTVIEKQNTNAKFREVILMVGGESYLEIKQVTIF